MEWNAPKPVYGPTCDGWWDCLDGTDQAMILTAAITGGSIILAAVIVSLALRKRKGRQD